MMRVAVLFERMPDHQFLYLKRWMQAMQGKGLDLEIRTLRGVPSAGQQQSGSFAHPADSAVTERFSALRDQFDVIHYFQPKIALQARQFNGSSGARTLLSLHGDEIAVRLAGYSPLSDLADHLHFPSRDLLQRALEIGYAGDRHTVIPPPVDVDFFSPLPEPRLPKGKGDPFVIVSSGDFTWSKGWEFALLSIAILVERGWDIHYTIIGEGEYRVPIVYTAHELDIQERVHLFGWQSAERLKKHLQGADLYMLASVIDTLADSVLQAQACGLAVVCSDAGALPESIVDQQTGLLAHRRDAWDMADKVEALLSAPQTRLAMGEKGRQRAQDHFSMESHMNQFSQLYHSLL